MYTPHHTISHTHTPQEWKTSKNKRKFLASTGIHYENACVNVMTQPVSRKKTSSRTSTQTSPSSFHFTYFSAYTGWREHGTIQPVWWSLRIQYQFTTSYLIKLHMLHMPQSTSSARINFASIIRCQINLLHTSCLWVAAVSLCHTICKATSNVNYTSYWFVSFHLHASRNFSRTLAGENTAPSSQCFRKSVNW